MPLCSCIVCKISNCIVVTKRSTMILRKRDMEVTIWNKKENSSLQQSYIKRLKIFSISLLWSMITYFIKAYKINSKPTTMLQSSTMFTSPVNLILFFAKGAIITQESRPIEFAMPVENVKRSKYLYHYFYILFSDC